MSPNINNKTLVKSVPKFIQSAMNILMVVYIVQDEGYHLDFPVMHDYFF